MLIVTKHFSYNVMRACGHNVKTILQVSRINCSKYYFIIRGVSILNGLDESVVNSQSVSYFLSRLGRGRAYTAN